MGQLEKDTINMVGYADRFSVKPGEVIKFMISHDKENSYNATVVRLINGMTGKSNEIKYKKVEAGCNGEYKGKKQYTNIGSYARLSLTHDWVHNGEFSGQLWMCPTITDYKNKQIVYSVLFEKGNSKISLYVERNNLLLSLMDKHGKEVNLKSELKLIKGKWYFVGFSYSRKNGQLSLATSCQDGWQKGRELETVDKKIDLDFSDSDIEGVMLAAEQTNKSNIKTKNHYNGKIENPRFFSNALTNQEFLLLKEGVVPSQSLNYLVADYNFGDNISSDFIRDSSGNNFIGRLYQGPARAVTGHNWSGKTTNFRHCPEEYSAIHFHDDDLEDAEWTPCIEWKVPANITSGIYALKLADENEIDYIPFFIRPSKEQKKSDVLFLVPTNTYLAYANERLFEGDLDDFMEHEMNIAPQDRYICSNPVGKSQYDTHTDGSGVMYSSRLRPIMNIRPHYRNWLTGTVRHLAADLYITGWLENSTNKYDVATDEDLDSEGLNLLRPYKVIITGSHPEYWTRPMMEALRKYLASGGKLMYLGANGFYWVTSLGKEKRHVAEIRRGNSGTRCWDSAPGETYHSLTGERGSLWRYNGYVPQQMVGVGFSAQGWGKGSGYKRLPDSFDPRVKEFFDGIKDDEIIGNFGYVLGGAAGDEIDKYDIDLGTPTHALRLATTTGFDNHYQFVIEEQLMTSEGQGGKENELVRADITYFDIEGGGEVFSVGSICWAGSLAWNNFDNNVATLSSNVLDKFLGRTLVSNTNANKTINSF